MIKLILSDMDGTLLDENGQLPEEFDEVMAMLKERDILFAPASGRQHDGLQKQFAKYKDDFVFVAENGTYVTYKQQELFSTTLKEEHVKVLEAAVEAAVEAVLLEEPPQAARPRAAADAPATFRKLRREIIFFIVVLLLLLVNICHRPQQEDGS